MRESRFAGVPLSNRGILKDAPRFIQRAFCNRMDQRCSACWSVKVLRKYGEAEGAPDFYHAWKYRHPNKRLPDGMSSACRLWRRSEERRVGKECSAVRETY